MLAESERLSSLRATRYFAKQCISCGEADPTERLHPTMTDALTHCRVCAGQELAAREKAARRNETVPPFLIMRVME